jgi:hypothetical protein
MSHNDVKTSGKETPSDASISPSSSAVTAGDESTSLIIMSLPVGNKQQYGLSAILNSKK